MKKQTILGKHSKKITNGIWRNNTLCLGSEDKTVTLSKEDGDTIEQIPLKAEPERLQFWGIEHGSI